MKRKMAMALAAVLVAGSLPVTVSAATFSDINEVSWASSTIQAVSDLSLIHICGFCGSGYFGKGKTSALCVPELGSVLQRQI